MEQFIVYDPDRKPSISKDKKKIAALWDDFAAVWSKGKKNDPKLIAIRVTPGSGYYWDTLQNKMITLLKIAFSHKTQKSLYRNYR